MHHTDTKREDLNTGHADDVVPLAKKAGWSVIDRVIWRWRSAGLGDAFPLMNESVLMPGTRTPYPAEFGEQLVGLVRASRSDESVAREYEPSGSTTHDWGKQARKS